MQGNYAGNAKLNNFKLSDSARLNCNNMFHINIPRFGTVLEFEYGVFVCVFVCVFLPTR